jgi:hypothetical protein
MLRSWPWGWRGVLFCNLDSFGVRVLRMAGGGVQGTIYIDVDI